MDEQVLRAMARWPNVPAVYGWLRLDRRGQWFLVVRNQPGFDERLHGDGSLIRNQQICTFIGRNYQPDEQGRWFWQNGPQRVFVDLQATPLIVRCIDSSKPLIDHTGALVELESISAAGIGPAGEVLLATARGPALVHDLDLAALDIEADASGAARALVLGSRRLELEAWPDPARRLGFVARPRAA